MYQSKTTEADILEYIEHPEKLINQRYQELYEESFKNINLALSVNKTIS